MTSTPNVDFAQSVLSPVQTDNNTKAQAWEAYHNSSSIDDFQTKVSALNLPQSVKADLWEGVNMRLNGGASAPSGVTGPAANAGNQTPSATVQPLLPNGLPAASYQAVPAEQTQAGHDAAIRQREDTSGLGTVGNAVAQTGIGFAKGAGDTLEHTVGKVIPGTTTTDEELSSNNGWQTTGKVGENIMEFVAGDEALKGLSIAQKLGVASKIAAVAEKSPTLAKALEIGMNAIRTGAVAGTQTLAKGGSVGDAAESAGLAGAGSAVIEGALPPASRALSDAVKPDAVKAAEDAATAQGVQQGITNVVKDTAGSTADIKPTAADPYGARQVAAEQIGRYKSAANQLDELSGNKFSEAQQAVEDSSNDFTTQGRQAARQAEQNLNDVVEQYRPELEQSGVDVDGMKDTYKAGIANNKIANFLSSTVQEVGKGSDELTASVKPGPQLKEKILDLAQNNKDLLGKAGWTSDHINQAVQFARKMDTPAATKTTDLVTQLLQHKLGLGAGAGALTGGISGYKENGLTGAVEGAAKGAVVGAIAGKVVPAVLWKIVSNPLAVRYMNSGLATGASAQTVAPYVADEISSDTGFMSRLKQVYQNSRFSGENGEINLSPQGLTKRNVAMPLDEDNLKNIVDPKGSYYKAVKGQLGATTNPGVAEELTQDTMSDFVKNVRDGKFTGQNGDASVRANLRSIAANKAADWIEDVRGSKVTSGGVPVKTDEGGFVRNAPRENPVIEDASNFGTRSMNADPLAPEAERPDALDLLANHEDMTGQPVSSNKEDIAAFQQNYRASQNQAMRDYFLSNPNTAPSDMKLLSEAQNQFSTKTGQGVIDKKLTGSDFRAIANRMGQSVDKTKTQWQRVQSGMSDIMKKQGPVKRFSPYPEYTGHNNTRGPLAK